MTEKPETDRVVTVAELLARHGQVSGTAGRAHRRRAREGGISVAELTGEIPIIREVEPTPEVDSADTPPAEDSTADAADAAPDDDVEAPRAYSALDAVADAGPQSPREFASTSAFPAMAPLAGSIMNVDVADARSQAVEEAPAEESPLEESPLEESPLEDRPPEETSYGEESAQAPWADDATDEPQKGALRQWLALAAQAVLGVAVGAALFIGFGRLWENDTLWPVALVLAILVILTMVAVVRILRKTDDIFSLLLAVVVGIIVTIGPLVLVKSTT